MEPPTPFLSLIVPAYNEARRIGRPLTEMGAFLARQPYSSEILVVDDGSCDGTSSVVSGIAPTLSVPLRLIRYPRNRGKGYALKVGFQAARGERLVFSDCDLSTPLDEMPRFLAALDENWDFAIGSRNAAGARITRHQPRYRENLGKVFTWLVRKLIADVSDATCGFKAFRRDVGKDLFARTRIDSWSFDAEVLLIARRRGYRLTEIPVRWEDREGSKVNLLRDILNSLIGIARMRANDVARRYQEPRAVETTTEEFPPAETAKLPRPPVT
jgi:dolichyl-phosphate beta-glucosyltransferase